MADAVFNPNENEFIKERVDDKLHRTIVSELTTRKTLTKKNKGGPKIKLTREMLRDFLYYVSMGVSLKDSAEFVHMGEDMRQDYNKRSATFSRVSSLAKNNVSLRARITVAKSIMGQPPQYFKLIHPETKQPKYIELKEIVPNVAVAQWWLEKVDKIGGDEGGTEAPQLGAPRNEEEANLLLLLLNKHSDYVKAKNASKK